MNTLTKLKVEASALRIYIFASGFGLTIYCGMLCMGIRHALAEWLALTLAYSLLFGGAWVFKLCWLSWAFVIYTYLIRCCIIVHRLGWFGEYINVAHLIALVIGVILCFIFLLDYKKYLAGAWQI